jgi:hypothetical protein
LLWLASSKNHFYQYASLSVFRVVSHLNLLELEISGSMALAELIRNQTAPPFFYMITLNDFKQWTK